MECLICLKNIDDKNDFIIAQHDNIKHNDGFCIECWNIYIKNNNKCPICRGILIKEQKKTLFVSLEIFNNRINFYYVYFLPEVIMLYGINESLKEYQNERSNLVDILIKNMIIIYLVFKLFYINRFKITYCILFTIFFLTLSYNFFLFMEEKLNELDRFEYL